MHRWIKSIWSCQLHRYTRVQLLMHNSIISLGILTLGLNYSCEEKHLLGQKPPGLWLWISQLRGWGGGGGCGGSVCFSEPSLSHLWIDDVWPNFTESQWSRRSGSNKREPNRTMLFCLWMFLHVSIFSLCPMSTQWITKNIKGYWNKCQLTCNLADVLILTIIRITEAVSTIAEVLLSLIWMFI